MNKQQTVTINGTSYDARSGLPLSRQSSASPAKRPVASTAIHARPKKATTLSRKQVRSKQPRSLLSEVKRPTKSPHISRFAPDVTPKKASSAPAPKAHKADIPPIPHKASSSAHPKKPTAHTPTNQERKHHAIATAVANTDAKKQSSSKKSQKKTFWIFGKSKSLNIMIVSVAALIAVGSIVYVNMPHLLVSVASAQSGMAASYPSYQPSGYGLKGPIESSEGKVMMKFAAHAGPQWFSITQTKSNWDSSALLVNYVEPNSKEYITYNDSGLTIYVYDNNASWVSGGILYTIKGNSELPNDQIRRIATSL